MIGNGWDFDYVSLHMVSPDYMPIIGFPTLWSSSSDGKIKANVIHINFNEITSVEDLEQYRGKLDGRIVFIMPVQEISPYFGVQMWDPGAGLKGVGLLGLKFDQDAYDMLDWIAHINVDTYERLFPEGMMQSSVVVATFLYQAAMRDQKLPRVSPKPW